MKIVISEQQLRRIITEQSEDSSVSCDKNISKDAGYLSAWQNMDPIKRKELLKSIKSTIDQALIKSKEEYIKWFQHPKTIQKFKTPEEREVLKKLPTYLQSINTTKLAFKGSKTMPNAIAWVTPNTEPTVIFYNISQIHDGTDFRGDSVEPTTKHEMGHLIDAFFKKNGVETYLQTIDTSAPGSYQANYLINDKDQYTRLNVLRGIIGAGPNDHPSTLLKKFMSQVNSGKITSDKFNFSSASSETTPITQKNDLQTTKQIWKILINNILVDGKPELNIGQLFSTFATERGGTVYVSFDLLAQFNLTAKDLEKKYYFLKMSPK